MLFTQLLSHHWKSFIRNAMWRRNITSRILMGFMIIYFIALFVSLGYQIEHIVYKYGRNPVTTFNGFLIWYFLGDLLVRCMFQPLPMLHIVPYLRLKIRRNRIINYLFVRNLWTIFNVLPWLVIVPFSVKILSSYASTSGILTYFLGFMLLLIFNNFLSALIKYLSQKQFVYFFIPLLLFAAFYVANIYYPVQQLSASLGDLFIQGNLLAFAACIAAIIIVYFITRNLLISGFYTDEIKTKRSGILYSGVLNMELFNRFGLIGKYMDLELNLMLRNKRPRQGLTMMPFFVAYFIYIFSRDIEKLSVGGFGVYFMSILVGFGALIYGQYIFSWESSYMDGMMARRNELFKYISAKYYFMSLLALISYIAVFTAFIFIPKANLLSLTAVALFVMGVMQFIIIFMGTNNDSRIDLSRSQFFNYQGVKGQQFLLAFAYFLIPVLIFVGAKALFGATVAAGFLSFIGLLFIIFHSWWIKKVIIPRFISRKYKNLEGYRKLNS